MIPHDDRPATPSEALQIALTHEAHVSGCDLDWIRQRQSPGTRSALDHALTELARGDRERAQEYVRLACELSRQASQPGPSRPGPLPSEPEPNRPESPRTE